jgi:hypothetical protein
MRYEVLYVRVYVYLYNLPSFADMESNDGEELDFEPSNVEAGGSGTAVPDNTSDTTMQVPVRYSSVKLVREFSHETESRRPVEFYYSSIRTGKFLKLVLPYSISPDLGPGFLLYL